MVGVTQVSARINDDDLEAFLDDRASKSETVREALRYYRLQQEGVGDDRLTDDQRAAYQWFRDRVGVDQSIPLGPAKSKLSQQVGLKKGDLRYSVFEPLNRLGYIDVRPRMHDVVLTVRPPENAREGPRSASEADDVEEVGERMDALAEAGEEVSQSAD